MKRSRMPIIIGAALAASVSVAAPVGADDEPSLDPAVVEATLFPGDSIEVDKSVDTPEIPPDPEIYFLIDTTGSMGPVIDEVTAGVGDIIDAVELEQPNAEFGLGQYRDFPSDAFAYQHVVSIGGDVATGLAGLSAGGGGDGPEGQFYALDRIANANTPEFSGSPTSTPIVVWIGDAPAHDPVCAAFTGNGAVTEATVTSDLVAAGYTVVSVSTNTSLPFYPDGLDDDPTAFGGDYSSTCDENGTDGQASRITAATGGTSLSGVSPAGVVDAILAAIAAVEIEVSMTSDCSSPISTTFAPDTPQVVESGATVEFVETISVAADAPGGVYECRDWALIDGEPMVDSTGAIVYETKTILVPENFVTGGGKVTEGKGKNRTDLLRHGGNAGYTADGSLVGQWNFQLPSFPETVHIRTTEITGLQFLDTGLDPAPPDANADTAVMTADARVRVGNAPWEEGCTLTATLVDGGEPEQDTIDITASCASGDWSVVGFEVTGGNIQIHGGTKG